MEQTVRILVVDDEPDIRNILRILLCLLYTSRCV